MTRQIGELNENVNDVTFHLTSLNPIRPENKADNRENLALKTIEDGIQEVLELVTSEAGSSYRYMAPLLTVKKKLPAMPCETRV